MTLAQVDAQWGYIQKLWNDLHNHPRDDSYRASQKSFQKEADKLNVMIEELDKEK